MAAWNTNYLLATYFNVTAPGVPYVTSKLGDEIELAARQNTIRPLQSVRSKTDFDLIKEYEQYWSLMDIENPHEIYFTNYTVGRKYYLSLTGQINILNYCLELRETLSRRRSRRSR